MPNGPIAGESYWVLGGKLTFKLVGSDTDGAMMLLHAELPSLPGPPPHVHDLEDEVFYVLNGEITVLLDGEVSKAGPGTTVFLPRHKKHTFWNESGAMATMVIMAMPAGLEHFFKEIGTLVEESEMEAPPVTPEMIAHLYETATRYGMELDPPPM